MTKAEKGAILGLVIASEAEDTEAVFLKISLSHINMIALNKRESFKTHPNWVDCETYTQFLLAVGVTGTSRISRLDTTKPLSPNNISVVNIRDYKGSDIKYEMAYDNMQKLVAEDETTDWSNVEEFVIWCREQSPFPSSEFGRDDLSKGFTKDNCSFSKVSRRAVGVDAWASTGELLGSYVSMAEAANAFNLSLPKVNMNARQVINVTDNKVFSLSEDKIQPIVIEVLTKEDLRILRKGSRDEHFILVVNKLNRIYNVLPDDRVAEDVFKVAVTDGKITIFYKSEG